MGIGEVLSGNAGRKHRCSLSPVSAAEAWGIRDALSGNTGRKHCRSASAAIGEFSPETAGRNVAVHHQPRWGSLIRNHRTRILPFAVNRARLRRRGLCRRRQSRRDQRRRGFYRSRRLNCRRGFRRSAARTMDVTSADGGRFKRNGGFGRNDGQEHDALSAASGSAEASVETVGVTSADGGRFKRNGVLWTERRARARRVICRVRFRRRALCRGLSPEECGSGGEFNPGWSGWGSGSVTRRVRLCRRYRRKSAVRETPRGIDGVGFGDVTRRVRFRRHGLRRNCHRECGKLIQVTRHVRLRRHALCRSYH